MRTRQLRTARPLALLVFVASFALVSVAQNTCDSLNTVTFTDQSTGAYSYQFNPVPPVSGASIVYTEWGFGSLDFTDFSLAPQPQYTFPGPGEYLVCMRATVTDGPQTCQSTHCELLVVPEDPACASLVPDFTIGYQSGILNFIDQSTHNGPITSWTWDFGDGTGSTEMAPTHSYTGAGPYQACLTVATDSCSSTACNWIYMGPTGVPCDTLLHPVIGVIQYERTIAVFDQSVTSGMNSSIIWDFGDGITATGSPAIHTYGDNGYYQVCGEVDLWGPLTPDTCTASACAGVSAFIATGIGPHSAPEVLRAYPVPFTDAFTVEGADASVRWELVDVLGRTLLNGVSPAAGPFTIPGGKLAAGNYLLRLTSSTNVKVIHVVKSSD